MKPEPTFSKAEREECIRQMRQASSIFYALAQQTHNHTFIEFTGLINEYITVCEAAQAQDIDFMVANAHSGEGLPMKPHNFMYLAEKLNCIYGPTLGADPELRQAFIDAIG